MANRVFLNTLIIYAQKFSTAALALITTPLLLRNLGIEDYGVYTLTIGFVGFLSFLTWSLSGSTQRYLSVTIGQHDFVKLPVIIRSSFQIHFVYGLLVMLVILIFSLFFIDQFLNIPLRRQADMTYLMGIVSGISFFSIVNVPFIGTLRAVEDFFSIAVISLTESLLKLLMAFTLLFINADKLIFFCILMFAVSVVIFLAYFLRAQKYFPIGKSVFHKPDVGLVKEMLSFISWSMLGSLAVMSRNQGVPVLLNMFFNVSANAAYGIAQQVSSAMNILAQGVSGSMTPILMKSTGEGKLEKTLYIMRTMSKLSFFSISLLSIPALFEMPFILSLWLLETPADTVLFSRLIIVLVLVVILSSGMQEVFLAIGKVRAYNVYISLIHIFNLPTAYLFFQLGYANYSIIVISIVLEGIALVLRLHLLKKFIGYKPLSYLSELFQILIPTLFVSLILSLLLYFRLSGFVKLCLSFTVSLLISPVIIYRYSLDVQQKEFVLKLLSRLRHSRAVSKTN